VVLWSVHQGTGKTLLGYTLRDIYGDNAVEIKDKHLTSGFNTWARNRQFIIGDEVTSRSDKRDEADHLKGLITNEFVRINDKFIPEYTIPDVMNYIFTSNNPDAFFLESSDRRYFVWEIVGTPLPLGFYHQYDKWFKSVGPSHLFHHLLTLLRSRGPRRR
jgi:putative DNA primase/helicase